MASQVDVLEDNEEVFAYQNQDSESDHSHNDHDDHDDHDDDHEHDDAAVIVDVMSNSPDGELDEETMQIRFLELNRSMEQGSQSFDSPGPPTPSACDAPPAVLPEDWSPAQRLAHEEGERLAAAEAAEEEAMQMKFISLNQSLDQDGEDAELQAAMKASLLESGGAPPPPYEEHTPAAAVAAGSAAEEPEQGHGIISDDDGRPWKCPVCTLENKPLVLCCEACLTERKPNDQAPPF